MSKIYTSASRLVFLILAVSLVGLTFKGMVDPKDFVALTSMAFGYYFGSRTPQK